VPPTPPPEAFARLFESVHEGVYIGTLSAESALTLSANPYLKLMFGFAAETPQEDVRPFEPDRFIDPQAREGFLGRLGRDGSVTDYLLRVRRADRTPMWVEVTAHAESLPDGRLRVEALMRDVSERKRLEDQSRDLYHQLLQAEKLAALGQTISGVAHELNNPLATILTWAERLAQRSVDDQTRRGLETILSESERAAKIVRNLLTFARKGPSEGAPVVYEDNPTYQNLVGRVDHIAQMGALTTNFTLIKPGALHQANGGYLILDARKVLQQPYAWDALKRALQSHQVRIESLGQMLSLISTISLEPAPIPLDVKVALLGDRTLYYLLSELDPDFDELFKVQVDFDEFMDRAYDFVQESGG